MSGLLGTAALGAEDDEVSRLIQTLHLSMQRLEELTGGEVDAVAGPQGQTYLLAHAQDHAREREAAWRAEMLDALPAHVALLDPSGRVLAVNLAWRRYGVDNGGQSPNGGIGLNYLDVCAAAAGPEGSMAQRAEAGIRAVLAGHAPIFAMQYPCHSPRQQRWFQLTVAPLAPADARGAIVMHVDVTALKQAKDELQLSRQRLAAVIDSAMDAIISIDPELRIMLCNPAAVRMFGHSAAELLGQPVDMLLPAGLRAAHRGSIEAFGATDSTQRRMGRLGGVSGQRKGGEVFPIEASISKDHSSGRWIYTAILRDVTERTRADARIKRLNHLYAMLSGINVLIVRVQDRDTLFEQACRLAVETGGYLQASVAALDKGTLDGRVLSWHGGTAAQVEGLRVTVRTGLAESDRPDNRALRGHEPVICNDIANAAELAPWRSDWLARGQLSLACLPISADGRPDAVLTLFAGEAHGFDAEEESLLQELAGDLSFALDHLAKQARLEHLAYYDGLTGLAIHSLFLERVDLHMRSAAAGGYRLAVFVIDLDRFRSINDNFGRAAGDSLLLQVADWLKQRVGEAGLASRISADRFAAVLPRIHEGGSVDALLEHAQTAFSDHPFRLNDAVFRIAAKVGVAIYPDDGTTADVLFKNAEAALKKTKSSGDRYLFYARTMSTAVAGHPTLESQLRQALERQEYVLHYQPKLGLQSGKLCAVEALIRWNDPRTGLVPPGRFIPLLEQTGLIHEVGRWAIKQALSDYRHWQAAGLAAVRIAVNVSPLQLRHRGFIAELEAALGSGAGMAQGLELEITESVIMEDVQHSISILHTLRGMGLKVAIDDFGTGFSSLSYLARLPVDTLKIDRSFIVDMINGPQGLALVSTIIDLAHAMKLNVVAEGVETEEQSRLLRLLNCDEVQGYLYSRPLPAAEFEARFLQAGPS